MLLLRVLLPKEQSQGPLLLVTMLKSFKCKVPLKFVKLLNNYNHIVKMLSNWFEFGRRKQNYSQMKLVTNKLYRASQTLPLFLNLDLQNVV